MKLSGNHILGLLNDGTCLTCKFETVKNAMYLPWHQQPMQFPYLTLIKRNCNEVMKQYVIFARCHEEENRYILHTQKDS